MTVLHTNHTMTGKVKDICNVKDVIENQLVDIVIRKNAAYHTQVRATNYPQTTFALRI